MYARGHQAFIAAVLLDAHASRGKTPRARVTARQELLTLGVSVWLLGGVFLDGWAHNNILELESFFTPWHAVLYSGYVVCALWIGWLIGSRGGGRNLAAFAAAIPPGYELGVLGVVTFGLAGIADMCWHVAFGIERNLAALLSPTHLMLFLRAVLILTSPLRAAWMDTRPRSHAPGLRDILPPVLSLAAAIALTCFMEMPFWGSGLPWPIEARSAFGAQPDAHAVGRCQPW